MINDVTISACSDKFVGCVPKQDMDVPRVRYQIIDSIADLQLHGVSVAFQNSLKIRLMNMSNDDIHLKKHTLIAIIDSVDTIQHIINEKISICETSAQLPDALQRLMEKIDSHEVTDK